MNLTNVNTQSYNLEYKTVLRSLTKERRFAAKNSPSTSDQSTPRNLWPSLHRGMQISSGSPRSSSFLKPLFMDRWSRYLCHEIVHKPRLHKPLLVNRVWMYSRNVYQCVSRRTVKVIICTALREGMIHYLYKMFNNYRSLFLIANFKKC